MSRLLKKTLILFFGMAVLIGVGSCKSNKIACPTYADSMPEKKRKGKPGSQKPEIPKATKTKSGVLPPGYGKKK